MEKQKFWIYLASASFMLLASHGLLAQQVKEKSRQSNLPAEKFQNKDETGTGSGNTGSGSGGGKEGVKTTDAAIIRKPADVGTGNGGTGPGSGGSSGSSGTPPKK